MVFAKRVEEYMQDEAKKQEEDAKLETKEDDMKVEKVTLRLVAQYADIWHGFATKTEERSGIETVAHKNNVLNNWCEKVGRDPNEISRSIGIDIKRIDLADDLLEAGATEITLAVNGPSYDLTQVKEWIAWRDSKE